MNNAGWHEVRTNGGYDSDLYGRTWEDIALEHHRRIIALEKRIKEIERTPTSTLPIRELPKL